MRASRPAVLATAVVVLLLVPASAPAFTARGSTEQAYVLGARQGERLTLVAPGGRALVTRRADRFGSRMFRELAPGRGYRVRRVNGRRSARFTVLRPGQNPPAAFFRRKRLKQGLNYVKVRDGIELAMTVRLPPGKTLADGPFPTVVEYTGYAGAPPHDLLAIVAAGLSGGSPKADPLAPATSTIVGSVIAPLLGFATVSVQMRGSGCSGGDFDLFDAPTTYDGYDAIETVGAQPWVRGGKVGMVGISFSGITQLFVAGTRPPHLAAVAPLSVTDDTFYLNRPGGLRNIGFIKQWLDDRQSDARPAPEGGQEWAKVLVRAGDRHCRANQRLRLQTQHANAIIRRNPFRTPRLYDQRSPKAWMADIDVPTFLVGQWQDEQTSGHFADSLGLLESNPRVWISLQNGVHVDSLGPSTLTRWVEFLELYVADEVPSIPDPIRGLSDSLYQLLADAPAAELQQTRFSGTTSVAEARATFERDARVRLLMDAGAGPAGPGALGNAWELDYDAWPIRQVGATTFYFGPGGALDRHPPAAAGEESYVGDPAARPAQTLPGTGDADAWKAQPPYTWAPVAAGKGLGFVTAPLDRDVVIAGPSSVDLYLRSSARDTDLQATLSEVRPDGAETYVQSGWLRASQRKLDRERSTAIDPRPTHLARDARPVPQEGYTIVRVPVFPVAHAFRAGSRIRLTIQAPGGERARWRFETLEDGTIRDTIGFGGAYASKLVLPIVEGADARGTPLPGATALRGQPSRRYVAATNGG
ncbi:MAG TPA: CocE/NonD family hydrolase [Solirubrobacteraceae bacterium]|jgi:hypothetical protein